MDVQQWARALEICVALQCKKSGVAKIIKDDGTIGDYIERNEPFFPDDAAEDDFEPEKMRYQIDLKSYLQWQEHYREERITFVALIKTYLGSGSLARVRATAAGRDQNRRS